MGILYVEIEIFVYLKQEKNKLIKVTIMELIGLLLSYYRNEEIRYNY